MSKTWRKRQILVGSLMVALIAIASFLAPLFFAPGDGMVLAERYAPPSWEHPFGLDQNGTDVLMQVLWGGRISLLVAFSVVGVSAAIGLFIGSISGWRGGILDNIIMRLIDTVHAFPGFLLALALVAVLGPSLSHLILALCLTGWSSYARLVRGEILHLKSRDYVLGAVAAGASSTRVVCVHIWPNLVGLLAVQATFGVAGTIITESGLSFLGLGTPPTVPTWGSLLNAGRQALIEAPHLSLFPGLAILTLVLAFNLIGDGLRDAMNPRG